MAAKHQRKEVFMDARFGTTTKRQIEDFHRYLSELARRDEGRLRPIAQRQFVEALYAPYAASGHRQGLLILTGAAICLQELVAQYIRARRKRGVEEHDGPAVVIEATYTVSGEGGTSKR